MGDFNSQPTDSIMKDFMDANGVINLIKSNTCFKGKGSCIDLILTNRKYSFKHSNSVETGISDHHHLIYTMLKTTFPKPDPKLVQYRKYKTFNFESFKVSLGNALGRCSANYDDFNQIFTFTLNQHAPKKKKWIRGNYKPHMNKTLRKAIMLRSKLKNRANGSKDTRDIKMYKQQRNLVVRLNKDSNFSYFSNLDIRKESKPFWNACKPYFTNKHSRGDTSTMLVEKEELILSEKKICSIFNTYFGNIVQSLKGKLMQI